MKCMKITAGHRNYIRKDCTRKDSNQWLRSQRTFMHAFYNHKSLYHALQCSLFAGSIHSTRHSSEMQDWLTISHDVVPREGELLGQLRLLSFAEVRQGRQGRRSGGFSHGSSQGEAARDTIAGECDFGGGPLVTEAGITCGAARVLSRAKGGFAATRGVGSCERHR